MEKNERSDGSSCAGGRSADGSKKVEEEEVVAPFLYGAASLLDDLDKRMMVWLRDNRYVIGYLRSTDLFANLVLDDAVERIFVDQYYAEIPLGAFIVRGENVLMVGELDPSKSDAEGLCRLSFEQVLDMQRQRQNAENRRQDIINKALKQRGMQPNPDPLMDDN